MKGNVATTFALKFVGALLNLAIILILSNVLGPEYKGLCSLGVTIVSMAQILGDIVGGPAYVFLSKKFNSKFLINSTLIWNLPLALLLFAFTHWYLNYNLLLSTLVSAFSYFNAVFYSLNNILIGRQNFKIAAWLNFSQIAIVVIMLTLLLKKFPGPDFYFLTCLLSYFVVTITCLWILNSDEDENNLNEKPNLTEVIVAGFQNQTAHIVQFFNFRLSYFLISPFLLGIFSNATSIGESLWLISNSFATVLMGKTVNLSHSKENYLFRHFRMIMVLLIPAGIVLACIPDEFFTVIFGDNFVGIQTVLVYLVPGLIAMALYNIIGHYFSALGNFKYNILCALSGLTVTLSAVLVFTFMNLTIGLQEAAIITSISYLFNFLMALLILKKTSSFQVNDLLPGKEEYKNILTLIRSGINIFGNRE